MQALSVNPIDSVNVIDSIISVSQLNPVSLLNPVELLNPVDLLNPVKYAANILTVNPVIKPAKNPIDNVIEPELNNLTSKKVNGINRFLEAYGDCV